MSSAQDASDGMRLLEAPSPLVLVVVVVPSWWWRQRRKPSIALRTILARLIPPGTLARLALPANLPRLVTPPLVMVAAVPASSTSVASATVALIVALRASTDMPFSHDPELLAFVGVVAVHIAEGAERSAALG